MADSESSAGEAESQSALHPLKSALAVMSSAFHTRLELFVTEVEEERERLKHNFVLMLLLFFGLSLGLILLTVFAVAIFWEGGWVYALGVLACLYLSIGASAGIILRNRFRNRPEIFSATLAELAKDRDRLRSSSRE